MMYRNMDTNEIWEAEEIEEMFNAFRAESDYMSQFDSFEEYLDDQISNGFLEEVGKISYAIDCYDRENNNFHERIAVWSTNPETCAYADWMCEILKNGGEWDAPDGCTYSIHEEV